MKGNNVALDYLYSLATHRPASWDFIDSTDFSLLPSWVRSYLEGLEVREVSGNPESTGEDCLLRREGQLFWVSIGARYLRIENFVAKGGDL